MDMSITFTVDGVPPTYNESFKINYRRRSVYLATKAINFKKKIQLVMPYWNPDPDGKFKVDLEFHDNWYYKNKKLKKKDVQNMDKLVIDAIFGRLGIDDSRVWVNSNTKVQSKEKKTVINVEVIPNEEEV